MRGTDPDVLEEILARNLDQTVDFYVYSTETDTVRITTLMPTLKWGGNGCLGAAIGHGYLHSLPRKCCDSNGEPLSGLLHRRACTHAITPAALPRSSARA
jgi:hypothetical protein